jgi:hypothetical protein
MAVLRVGVEGGGEGREAQEGDKGLLPEVASEQRLRQAGPLAGI